MRRRAVSLTSLHERKELKRSVEDGTVRPFDTVDKRHKSLEDFGAEPNHVYERTKPVGSGVYGRVHLLGSEDGSPVVVAKIVGCSTNLLGDPYTDPFRSEHVEPRMARVLWNEIVLCNMSPHITAPVGESYHMVEWTAPEQRMDDMSMTTSCIHFMEWATDYPMRTYLQALPNKATFNQHLRVMLFQVVYTLLAIDSKFPRFRHNDLKDDNIMVHKGPSTGYIQYNAIGRTFHVPCVGAFVMLADFDFACIPGHMLDNYKTLEQQWETPTLSISSRHAMQDDYGRAVQSDDLATLIAYLLRFFHSRMDRETRDVLERTYTSSLTSFKKNKNRPMSGETYPSLVEFLLDFGLFDEFLLPAEETTLIWETYSIDPNNMGSDSNLPRKLWDTHALTIMSGGESSSRVSFMRHCPFFHIRANEVQGDEEFVASLPPWTPSQLFYLQAPPEDYKIDREPPTRYSKNDVDRLIHAVVADLYFHKDAFDFPVGQKDDFQFAVGHCVERFLQQFCVPLRWWKLAVTCAWMDVAMYGLGGDMFKNRPKTTSWAIDNWVDYWNDNVSLAGLNYTYTEMQLLHFFMQWTWYIH